MFPSQFANIFLELRCTLQEKLHPVRELLCHRFCKLVVTSARVLATDLYYLHGLCA